MWAGHCGHASAWQHLSSTGTRVSSELSHRPAPAGCACFLALKGNEALPQPSFRFPFGYRGAVSSGSCLPAAPLTAPPATAWGCPWSGADMHLLSWGGSSFHFSLPSHSLPRATPPSTCPPQAVFCLILSLAFLSLITNPEPRPCTRIKGSYRNKGPFCSSVFLTKILFGEEIHQTPISMAWVGL